VTRYRTQEGDVLDRVCWKHYGRTGGVVELVLEANPGLAGRGPVLPIGMDIVLPDVPTERAPATVRLWS
jgi:phage tail protein X